MARIVIVLSTVATLGLASCGPSFESAKIGSSGNNSSGGGVTDPNSQFQNLKVDGTVSGGSYGDNEIISLDKVKKELVVRLPNMVTPIMHLTDVVQVPAIPGAILVMEPTPDGNHTLALRIPLSHVIDGIKSLPPSKLPNGDPIPAVPDGELPSVAVQLTHTSEKATIFLSSSVVGLYVNSEWDPSIAVTLPIRNESRTTTWGYFAVIPAKSNGTQGGFFVSIKLPTEISRIIDDAI